MAPLVRDRGRLVETDWDTAMSRVVERSRSLLDTKGPLSHAFFTSGQLMIEESYTLAVIGKAGIDTPHMDGNTRWCAVTAAAALQESFGCDGQPGSYTDIDSCDAVFLFGHNVAETQTVLWARILDRLDGPDLPRLVCVDPRRTNVADRATVHLQIRNGHEPGGHARPRARADRPRLTSSATTWPRIRSAWRDSRSGPAKPPRSGRPRSAGYPPRTSAVPRRSSAPASEWCRQSRWASTSPIRRPPPPVR